METNKPGVQLDGSRKGWRSCRARQTGADAPGTQEMRRRVAPRSFLFLFVTKLTPKRTVALKPNVISVTFYKTLILL